MNALALPVVYLGNPMKQAYWSTVTVENFVGEAIERPSYAAADRTARAAGHLGASAHIIQRFTGAQPAHRPTLRGMPAAPKKEPCP